MKQKLFTLLTLLVMCVTGAWADVTLTVSNTTAVSETFADGSILYSIDSDGRVISSTKFGSDKDIVVSGTKTKGAALVDKRFAIKFPVAVSSVTIYGYNSSSGRTLSKVYTSTTMEKSSYTEITSSTTLAGNSTTPNYSYTFTASWTTPIAANTAIWFEFNNSCNFYTITYVSSSTSYTVTYNNNGGTGTIANSTGSNITLSDGTGFTAPSNYTFAGWNTANDGSGTSYAASQTGINANLDLFATWTQSATIDANGGSANTTYTATLNATTIAIASAPTNAGKTLTGYFDAATGGNKIANADGSLVANTSYADANSKWNNSSAAPMLYAQWEAENPIIFSMTDITKLSGDDVTNNKDVAGKKTGDVIATFNTGSSAIVFNNKSGAAEMLSNSDINLGGSGDSYFKATFTRELAEGDVISSSVENSFNISYQNSSYYELTLPYTIPSGSSLIGKTTLFVKKKGASRFSSFTIRRPGEDEVNNPVIAFSSNSLTITCSTKESSIYYTTDGTEPTVSSTQYTAAVALTNSCTVRAKAFKGASNEYSSEIVKKDCYVNNASTEGFMAKLGMSGGSMNADNNVWTSTDNKYIFTNTSEGRTIQYATLETNSDAFKINHNDVYTLKVSDDIKITKIVFVGKSWLTGSASTISIDDFDGTGNFYAKEEGVDTYVGYQTFTPQSELDYGATVTIRPSANQLGAYIEVYGTIKTYDVTKGNHTNGDFTIATSPAAEGATVTLTATPSAGYDFTGWEILKTDGGSDVTASVSLSSATASPATFTMPAYGVTVNATFATARYTVTYNANGGTCATASEKQATSGAAVTLPTPTFEGCTFDGWYNAGTKIGDAAASYTPTADITLYAKWTDNSEGKLFSYIDGNYGDKFQAFDGSGWVSGNGSNKNKTFEDASGAKFVVTKGAWDNKNNSISALAKFANGTSGMSVVIPEGKVATVKILYGSYNTSRKLTVGGVAQAAPTAKFEDSHSNSTIASDMTEVTLNNQAGTLTLGSSDGNIYIGRVIVTDLSSTLEGTIPANKEWITFCSTANLDFSSDIAGLEGAYTITAHADKATALTATKMTGKVKAGTGLLLRAAAVDATNPQVITIPVVATGEEQAGNMLKGVTVDTEVQPTAGDYTNLGLSNGEFHPYSAAGTLAAGKAYLQVPTAQMPSGGNNARLYIVLDGEATGIANVDVNANDNFDNAPMYNLAGQKVSKSYKGIVIVNGKKYINK